MKAKKQLQHIIALAIVITSTLVAAAESGVYEGSIRISNQQIHVAGKDFVISKQTTCRDHRGLKTTCGTLAQVGYADKARVTVWNGLATNVDIMKLEQ